jgi:hypothetical protein
MVMWYIFMPFGNVVVIWYIFPRFGILRQEKSGNPVRVSFLFTRSRAMSTTLLIFAYLLSKKRRGIRTDEVFSSQS